MRVSPASTRAISTPWLWLYEAVGQKRLPIINYSGGTEIAGGILMGNWLTPLKPASFAGPIAGMAADVVDAEGRSVRGIYLDGFGALFMIKVRFPVFTPSATEQKEPQPTSDSEWDKARRELYGEAEDRPVELVSVGSGSQYDSEQVEELKKTLFQTLKSASNIHLKADDSVAITVFCQPATAIQGRKSRSKAETVHP